MDNLQSKVIEMFPAAPVSATFVVEMQAGSDFEVYTVRLTNGMLVYGSLDYARLVKFLDEQRDRLLGRDIAKE